jgi:hypothetical protein
MPERRAIAQRHIDCSQASSRRRLGRDFRLIPTYLTSEDAPNSDVRLMQALLELPERSSNTSQPWTICIEDAKGRAYRIIMAAEPELRSLRELLHELGYLLARRKEGRTEVYKLR